MYLREVLSMDPFREMGRFQREMNRLFDGVTTANPRNYPAIKIWTNPEAATVTAELPGYDAKAVHLMVTGDVLTIKGNRMEPELDSGDHVHRQERQFGEFERTLRLPFAIESDKVEARFTNGVLQILLPRAEADRPKRIEIKTL